MFYKRKFIKLNPKITMLINLINTCKQITYYCENMRQKINSPLTITWKRITSFVWTIILQILLQYGFVSGAIFPIPKIVIHFVKFLNFVCDFKLMHF